MMPIYVCMFLVAILCTILVVLFDSYNKESITPFIVVLALLVLVSILLGGSLLSETGVKKDKPITPSIETKCINGKCDTTYVYKFNEE